MSTYNIDNVPAQLSPGDIINCPYSGSEKSITLPKGSYKLECWGAKGQDWSIANHYGGYSVGTYNPNSPITLYLNAGGNGSATTGGYNGGGNGGSSSQGYGGGGATHIGRKSGLLTAFSSDYSTQLLLVAGGSGGVSYRSYTRDYYAGGSGGGSNGGDGSTGAGNGSGLGGTQSGGGGTSGSGGSAGTFGKGGNSNSAGGGGGGFYGGGGGGTNIMLLDTRRGSGGGGSGYINSTFLTSASTTQESYSSNPDTANHAGYIRITVISVVLLRNLSVVYGNSLIVNEQMMGSANVTYNGTLFTLSDGAKTLNCKGKYMKYNVGVGAKTLNCKDRIASYNLTTMLCNGAWEVNTALAGGTAGTVASSGWITTPYIKLPTGCTNITIECGGTNSGCSCLHEFNSGLSYLSYWGASPNPRTFTFDYPNDIKYIRATFNMANLANCYIYDNTHGQYIYRGGNV